jgi:hypothetical protein
MNFMENDALFFHSSLMHSTYVYSARIYPEANSSGNHLIVATACFDGKVRLWMINIEDDVGDKKTKANVVEDINVKAEKVLEQKASRFANE